jgi:hypothetical protein
MRIDRAVGAEVIARLQPLGVEAAIGAMEARRAETEEKRRQINLAIELDLAKRRPHVACLNAVDAPADKAPVHPPQLLIREVVIVPDEFDDIPAIIIFNE